MTYTVKLLVLLLKYRKAFPIDHIEMTSCNGAMQNPE